MKGERKLRLVVPPASAKEDGDEPPFSPEELAAATALRESLGHAAAPTARGPSPTPVDPRFELEHELGSLAAALKAAARPATLGEADHDAILARVFGDESAATQAERAAAERLRAELAGEATTRDSALLHELRLAARPTALAPERNEELIAAALRKTGRPVLRRLSPVTMAALASVAAIAAGVALFIGRADLAAPRGAETAALVRSRSTEMLFDAATPFPRRGQESARIDRIASARSSDLRKNRFTAWGVK